MESRTYAFTARLATLSYACLALCGLPFFYARRIEDIIEPRNPNRRTHEHEHEHEDHFSPERPKQGRSLLADVVSLCSITMSVGNFTML